MAGRATWPLRVVQSSFHHCLEARVAQCPLLLKTESGMEAVNLFDITGDETVEHRCTTIATSLQARHPALQRAAASDPASIARLLLASDNHQTPKAVVRGVPYDYIRAPITCRTPLQYNMRRPLINGRRKQSYKAPRTTTFGLRKPSELRRWLSEHGRRLSKRGHRSSERGRR